MNMTKAELDSSAKKAARERHVEAAQEAELSPDLAVSPDQAVDERRP